MTCLAKNDPPLMKPSGVIQLVPPRSKPNSHTRSSQGDKRQQNDNNNDAKKSEQAKDFDVSKG